MFHLKTSNDLEIYDIDETSKEKIEEIFDLRQPVLFSFYNDKIIEATNKSIINKHYGAYDIKIRNINDTVNDNINSDNAELHVPLSVSVANKLFEEDKESIYYSENNSEFLEESGILKSFKLNDSYLRPVMVSNCYYDIFFGSKNVFTPLRYEINYRNFFLVTQGSVKIKICAPHNKKHLYVNYDYDNFEFSSRINPWNPQQKYKADFERVKFIEFVLTPGKMFFLPANWWYSIQFLDSNTSVSSFRYRTYMNNLSVSPYIFLHFLQLQNVKRTTTHMSVNDISKTTFSETTNQNTINEATIIENKLEENINEAETVEKIDELIESTNINDLDIQIEEIQSANLAEDIK